MVTLIAIDASRVDESPVFEGKNVELVRVNTEQEFFEALRSYCALDVDAVISDTRINGVVASLLYFLNKGVTQPMYKCVRIPMSSGLLDTFKRNRVRTILSFDWFSLYGSDLSLFDKVVLINPLHSGLFENATVSELVHDTFFETTPFMRDLCALASISSARPAKAHLSVKETVIAYAHLFPDLVDLARDDTLFRYHAQQSPLQELLSFFESAYIVDGEIGVQELVKIILKSDHFSYDDVFSFIHHPAVKFLRREGQRVDLALSKEVSCFSKSAKTASTTVCLFSPSKNTPGFIERLSSELCERNYGKIIMLKSSLGEQVKYTIAHRGLLVDVGRILEDMGVGGGYPDSAAALVGDDELFEEAFIRRVSDEEGLSS